MSPLPLFSVLHQVILLSIILFWMIIPLIGKNMSKENAKNVAFRLAFLIIFLEIYLFIYRQSIGIFDPSRHIPIHLCSFAEFCVAYALVSKNQRAFELAFFWSFAGSIQALLTPNLSGYSLFDTEFIIFFISHGLIILNVIWLLYVDKMKIRSISLLETFIATNLLLIPIGLIDWLGNANYMYLRYKPPVNNPFLIGEWPWYILGFEAVAIIFLFNFFQ